jgi:Asp-tRNA(Asn)/Glu-tRNA(Gln) amidotransferase B subunit
MKLWFTLQPHEICELIGINTTKERAQNYADFIEDCVGITGWDYLAYSSMNISLDVSEKEDDEVLKWILGPYAEYLNKHNISFKQSLELKTLPPKYLKSFITAIKNNLIYDSFRKNVFFDLCNFDKIANEYMEIKSFNYIDKNGNNGSIECPIKHYHISPDDLILKILDAPEYLKPDNSLIDDIISKVFNENVDKVIESSDNPKTLQWLVGQVIKASERKISGKDALQEIKKILNLD